MAKKADIGSKRLISIAPDLWLQWVTQIPGVVAGEILASEFQWLSRESDVILQAYSPEDGDFLVLNELQLRYTSQMPKRVRAYVALAEEKYNLPVYPVLVNILPPPTTVAIASQYKSNFRGLRARQDYKVINLWEVEAEIVFQQPLPVLAPFVPILKGGGKESTIRQALSVLRADNQLTELEPLLAFFASFVLSSSLVQQIMRWDMTVLRESPWYQEILDKGLQQGLQQGRLQELLSGIARSLELKFGAEGLQLMSEIRAIDDLEKLSTIRDGAIMANSLAELRQIYN